MGREGHANASFYVHHVYGSKHDVRLTSLRNALHLHQLGAGTSPDIGRVMVLLQAHPLRWVHQIVHR